MSGGPRSVSGTEEVFDNDGPHYCCYSFHSRPWLRWAFLLPPVYSFTRKCPWTLPIVPAWPGIHLGPSYPRFGVAGLPSNPLIHISFETDSGPSEQLPSLAAKVSSHLWIQVMWLGTFTSFQLFLHGR